MVAETARRHPALVRGLVLVGPTTDPRAVPWPRLVGRWVLTAAREDPRRFPEIVREYLATRLSGLPETTMRRARHHDLRAALAGSSVPVLVLRGPHDRLSLQGQAPDVPMGTIFSASWPFVGLFVLSMVIVAIFPGLATWLASRLLEHDLEKACPGLDPGCVGASEKIMLEAQSTVG